jgi:DUF1009 family protein
VSARPAKVMKTERKALALSRPLVIVAGGGFFPVEVARHARLNGYDPVFLALKGFASRLLAQEATTRWVDLLKPQEVLAAIKALAPAGVILAGHVRRPGPQAMVSAFSHFRQSADLLALLSHGDDHLLRGALQALEQEGLKLLGIDEVAPGLLCPAGVLGAVQPEGAEIERMIVTGFGLLRALSPFDCGQGVVLEGERVLAVEGPEGTDRMLKRCRPRLQWLFPTKPVLKRLFVKAAKRGQERRVDLPAVGPRTIEACAKAGIAGLALQAGSVVMIERETMVKRADALGLFITGVKA